MPENANWTTDVIKAARRWIDEVISAGPRARDTMHVPPPQVTRSPRGFPTRVGEYQDPVPERGEESARFTFALEFPRETERDYLNAVARALTEAGDRDSTLGERIKSAWVRVGEAKQRPGVSGPDVWVIEVVITARGELLPLPTWEVSVLCDSTQPGMYEALERAGIVRQFEATAIDEERGSIGSRLLRLRLNAANGDEAIDRVAEVLRATRAEDCRDFNVRQV